MEKRRSPRLPIYKEVAYKSGDENVTSYLYDISRDGVFIHSPDPLEPGTRKDICFHIPGFHDSFNAQGIVIWNQKSESSSKPGMGVRFDKMENRGVVSHLLTFCVISPIK